MGYIVHTSLPVFEVPMYPVAEMLIVLTPFSTGENDTRACGDWGRLTVRVRRLKLYRGTTFARALRPVAAALIIARVYFRPAVAETQFRGQIQSHFGVRRGGGAGRRAGQQRTRRRRPSTAVKGHDDANRGRGRRTTQTAVTRRPFCPPMTRRRWITARPSVVFFREIQATVVRDARPRTRHRTPATPGTATITKLVRLINSRRRDSLVV